MVAKLRARVEASPAGSERVLTRDEMVELARTVDLDTFDCRSYREFKTECYARNSVLRTEFVELVVICWLPGQQSSVHDHGHSNCLYLVIDGEMEEEQFTAAAAGEEPRATGKRTFAAGDITVAAGDDIHRISNHGDEKLVTVHIYSPPLGPDVTNFTPLPRYDS